MKEFLPQTPKTEMDENGQEIKGKRKISIEINGLQIEGEKYYFEYPKNIQEETGILGYERVKINNSFLFEILDSNKEQKEKNSFLIKILSELSDGNYPIATANHQFGGNVHAAEDLEKYIKDFKNDKFFLQKIFDPNLLKEGSFEHTGFNEQYLDIDVFNKKDGSRIDLKPRDSLLGDVKRFAKELDNDDVFITTGRNGFNLEEGAFFTSPVTRSLSFGFSSEDPWFKGYLIKSLDFYLKDIFLNNKDKEKYQYAIYDLVKTIISDNKEAGNTVFIQNALEDISSKISVDIKKVLDELMNPQEIGFHGFKKSVNLSMRKSFFPEREESPTDVIDFISQDIKNTNSYNLENGYVGHGVEVRVPVFINNNEIPQLSWGHAKYAHYFNDKSFNFFKFKHADHLPVKKSKSS